MGRFTYKDIVRIFFYIWITFFMIRKMHDCILHMILITDITNAIFNCLKWGIWYFKTMSRTHHITACNICITRSDHVNIVHQGNLVNKKKSYLGCSSSVLGLGYQMRENEFAVHLHIYTIHIALRIRIWKLQKPVRTLNLIKTGPYPHPTLFKMCTLLRFSN